MTGTSTNPYHPGMRIKFEDFDKTYRVMDWERMAGTLTLLYGPFHVRTVDGRLRDHEQLADDWSPK